LPARVSRTRWIPKVSRIPGVRRVPVFVAHDRSSSAASPVLPPACDAPRAGTVSALAARAESPSALRRSAPLSGRFAILARRRREWRRLRPGNRLRGPQLFSTTRTLFPATRLSLLEEIRGFAPPLRGGFAFLRIKYCTQRTKSSFRCTQLHHKFLPYPGAVPDWMPSAS
jgi:hypothetical protein